MSKEEKLSFDAGALIGKLYRHLLTLYKNSNDPTVAKDINILCVRLAFCLYAEDAELFSSHSQFFKYLNKFSTKGLNNALEKLFKVLDTKYDNRSPNLSDDLNDFPYVNGKLFTDPIEIPELDEEFRDILLNHASAGFDWKDISPTIFGAIFESTINPDTRRSGGMHYTSIENIHKVIDPLFLNDLRTEFNKIKESREGAKRKQKLHEFQKKLGTLTFLDPACGSGNFLTETYLSLRKLENNVLYELYGGQTALDIEGFEHPIYVSLDQFYGIEINDYAVAVAQTALWIAEAQMKKETEMILQRPLEYLPLVSYENIHCANALRIDWNEVIPATKLNYIMGNPPFGGKKYQSESQKEDLQITFQNDTKKIGILDYVCAWFKKSAEMSEQNQDIRSALVATNSITQGELVGVLWKVLLQYNIKIDYAYRSFKWENEATDSASVYVVIVGFSHKNKKTGDKKIFCGDELCITAKHINGYLNDSADVVIEGRSKPISAEKPMTDGNVPIDGNFLKLEEDEYQLFKKKEPLSLEYIKKLIGSEEFINNKPRYVLWLVDCPPEKLRKMPMVMDRVEKVRQFRLNSKSAVYLAPTATTFRDKRNPDKALVIPRVSSERRQYIPIGFIDKNTIVLNAALMLPLADLYDFSILTSSVHMAWMRTVAGRLKSDYRYSKDIVYNNFIWPEVTEKQKEEINKKAQAILDARALYFSSSLADLYDPLTMPKELQEAHNANDKAVLALYGLSPDSSEEDIVSHLMNLYQKKIDDLSDIDNDKKKEIKTSGRKKKSVSSKKEDTLKSSESISNKDNNIATGSNSSNMEPEALSQESIKKEDSNQDNIPNNLSKTKKETNLLVKFARRKDKE